MADDAQVPDDGADAKGPTYTQELAKIDGKLDAILAALNVTAPTPPTPPQPPVPPVPPSNVQAVYWINQSGGDLPDADAAHIVTALNMQAAHLVELWPGLAPVAHALWTGDPAKIPTSAWRMYWLPDADTAGALGYHDVTDPSGQPFGRVFTRYNGAAWPALRPGPDGISISNISSHEAVEIAVDPGCQATATAPDGKVWALESCLAGETKVFLADGTLRSIAELARDGGSHEVVSLSPDGTAVRSVGLRPRKTGYRSVITVKLREGGEFRCTPDHRIMTSEGYRAAGHLRAGQVLPGLAVADSVDGRVVNAESAGEVRTGSGAGEDEASFRLSEFVTAVGFAHEPTVSCHPALDRGVARVVPRRTEEQVRRVDAGWIVTTMADEQARRDGSVRPFVTQPMGGEDTAAIPDLAVSSVTVSAAPSPAVAGLVHATPEAFFKRGSTAVVRSVGRSRRIDGSVPMPSRPMGRTESSGTQGPFARFDGAGLHTVIVDRVEDRGEKVDVFDLTVPGSHNFAIEAGVFVHNCDPVEAFAYDLTVPNGTVVSLSDFVGAAFFGEGTGAVDSMGQTQPWTIAPGGYALVDGVQIFADKPSLRFLSQQGSPAGRTARRLARATST